MRSSAQSSLLGDRGKPSLPLISSPGTTYAKDRKSKQATSKRRSAKRTKFSSKSLRKNPCFRAFLVLISAQVLILIVVGLFMGDNLQQVVNSRAETIRLIHDYYVQHFRYTQDDVVPTGIVVDDDYASKNPDSNKVTHEEGDDDLHEMEDHIANQAEEILNQAEEEQGQLSEEKEEDEKTSASDNSEQQPAMGDSSAPLPPIDNYYTRQLQQERTEDNPFQFLVVGGSDGSGTRAFVTALGKLGVPMIVDDRGTMDVHGKQLFNKQGWPPVVQLVMNHTHSANYEVKDLPQEVQDTVIRELTKMQKDLVKRGQKHDERELNKKTKKHHKVNHYDNDHLRKRVWKPHSAYREHDRRLLEEEVDKFVDIENAEIVTTPPPIEALQALNKSKLVQYGWKAPVSMLLLPFLREVFGPIKFLHVVRDGRDVAFSANQSPVKKFYNSFYKKSGEAPVNVTLAQNDTTMNVYAMELWNDWNLQVLEYEKTHVGKDFDYLVMRTEDLLNPETKFQSLQQLAHFVGSRNSLQDLCCQSMQAVVDMGQSSSHIGDMKGKRGGHHRFEHKGHIYDTLMREDEEGLDLPDFGKYVPWRRDFTQSDGKHLSDILSNAGRKGIKHNPYYEEYDHHKHARMGGDPILGFIKGENQAESDSKFDNEEGRHRNWHHGHMDTGPMMENARERRVQYNQQRHDKFRGLADRVADMRKKRQYKPIFENQKGGQDLPQNREAAHSFADRIAANHKARLQQQVGDPELYHTRDKRRRLLSSFNKLQTRHVPSSEKKNPTMMDTHNGQDGNEHAHRQFKPHHGDGEKVLKPNFKALRHGSESEPQRQERIQQQPRAEPDADSSWSFTGSLGKALGLTSNDIINNDAPPDQEMLDRFQHMPLLETGRRPHPQAHFERKKKKPAEVKARYGKWVAFLEDKPNLSRQLHELGATSLKAFGYEPSAPFLDTSGMDENFVCDSTVECKESPQDREEQVLMKMRAAFHEMY